MLSFTHTAIEVDLTTRLEPLNEAHARPLLDLVNNNRSRLREWLPWVDYMRTVENFLTYINRCRKQAEEGTDYSYAILHEGAVAGRIGIHTIDPQNNSGAIGYWIGQAHAGKGIVTRACTALVDRCFQTLPLNRIEIKCAAGNLKSAMVAERLGFLREGVLRQAERVNGHYLDLYLYAMLKTEWSSRRSAILPNG